MRKVIITCAVTGAIHTPSMSPALPVTPEQIYQAAVEAIDAGAAIIHLHARNPASGKPDQTAEAFAPFLSKIKKSRDAVLNLTTGGSPYMRIEERLAPALTFKPEVASMNMGSLNLGLFRMLERFKKFTHDWEAPYLANKEIVFRNTFKDIEFALQSLSDLGTRFEFECYDVGHLYNLAYFLDARLVRPPLFVQSVFGLLGGIGPHPEDVSHMRRTADRLFGKDYQWSVVGAGRHQLAIAAQSVTMGGNVRVGLEDSLWIRPGEFASSSAQQVEAVRTIIESLGHEVASPSDTRALLDLKGSAQVAF